MSSARDGVAAAQAIRLRSRGTADDWRYGQAAFAADDLLAALRALSEQELIACSDGVQLETLRALGV